MSLPVFVSSTTHLGTRASVRYIWQRNVTPWRHVVSHHDFYCFLSTSNPVCYLRVGRRVSSIGACAVTFTLMLLGRLMK